MNEIDREFVAVLEASKNAIGPIEKVTLNAKGELVDGNQRKATDPTWPEEINPNLKTEEQCVLFSIAKNWFRTTKSVSWKIGQLTKLAELGNDVKRIHEKTGIPSQTIRNLLPDKYKDPIKAEAGRIGGIMRSAATNLVAKSEDLRRKKAAMQDARVECQGCHLLFTQDKIEPVDGKPYCVVCGVKQKNIRKADEKAKADSKPQRQRRPREHIFLNVQYDPEKTGSAAIIQQVNQIEGVTKVTVKLTKAFE